MSDTAQLIQQSNDTFTEGDYVACLDLLEKLRNRSTVKNHVVEFNKSVTIFARSLWYDVDDFTQTLQNLSSSNEARSALNEYLLFNQAVLEFHAGRYSRVVDLLTQNLLQNDLSENVLVHSVLLLAEVYLTIRQPEQALKVLTKCDNFSNEKSSNDSKSSNELRLCFAKVRTCLLLRNYKMCQKEAKKLTNFNSCSAWTSTMLRAQHDYQRSSTEKSVKCILAAKEASGRDSFSSTGVCCSAIELNSLGCLYYQMNKPNLSLVYFRKALNEYSSAFSSLPRNSDGQIIVPLHCRSQIFRLYLLQNYGLALLHCQQPAAAFDCLIEIVKNVNGNARLWLRLAECCILAHKPNNEVDFEMQRRKRLMVKEVVGVGPHRKIILNTNLSGRKSNLPNEQGAIPTLSLEFAHFCLKNALATLPVIENDVLNALSDTNGDVGNASAAVDVGPTFTAPFSNPMTVKEVYRLKCSILCATSYVCLCLGEIQLAFESAKTLLNQKFVSSTHKLLGQLYAAEASIMSERMTDALNYLKPQLTPDRELTFAELWNGVVNKDAPAINNWFPKTTASFKIIFHYNTALAYTLQEDYEKAIQAITSIGDNVELPIQVTMLGLYIQIQLGQIDSARYTIMKTFPQLQTPLSFS